MRKPIVLLLVLPLLLSVLPLATGHARQRSRAGLVVQFSDGRLEKRCVEFDGNEIKGYDLLARSGLAIVADVSSPTGAAICKIEAEGCSADNCFCDKLNYWSYWHLKSDSQGQPVWLYSTLGASSYVVHAGEVDAWSFSAGAAPSVKPAFSEICAPATATTVATPAAPGAPAGSIATPPNTEPPPMTAQVISGPTHTPTTTRRPTTLPPTATRAPIVPQPNAPFVSPPVTLTAAPSSTAAANPMPSPSPAVVQSASGMLPTDTAAPLPASPLPGEARASATVAPPPGNGDAGISVIPLAALPAGRQATAVPRLLPAVTHTPAGALAAGPTPAGPAGASRLARWALLAGGLTGYLIFMLLFAGLGIGLVVMLLKDRKSAP